VISRNQGTTYWTSYREDLRDNTLGGFGSLWYLEDLEIVLAFLQSSTALSYVNNCPLRTAGGKRKVPWWSPQLRKISRESRKVLNKAKKTPCLLIGK
jgi:hypothetical protein